MDGAVPLLTEKMNTINQLHPADPDDRVESSQERRDHGHAGASRPGWGRAWFLIAICLLAVPPSLCARRAVSPAHPCLANVRQLEDAVRTWALEHKMPDTASPQVEDLVGPTKYIRDFPNCPLGGTYTFHPPSRPAECSIHGTPSAPILATKGPIQLQWERRAIWLVLCLGLVGAFLSTPSRLLRGKGYQPVAACLPLLLLATTIVLVCTHPDWASNAMIVFSSLLTLAFSARAICLPRQGHRIVGWAVGSLVVGVYMLLAALCSRVCF